MILDSASATTSSLEETGTLDDLNTMLPYLHDLMQERNETLIVLHVSKNSNSRPQAAKC